MIQYSLAANKEIISYGDDVIYNVCDMLLRYTHEVFSRYAERLQEIVKLER